MEGFDYAEAIAELERIAAKVEDPETGIAEIDGYIARSSYLVEQCRAYLRTARQTLDDNNKKL